MNDFILENDLLFKNGDLHITDASQQNIASILLSQKGGFKEHPLVGVGIENYLKGNTKLNKLRLEAEIEKQYFEFLNDV